MNEIPPELFVNITNKGLDWGVVCIEHMSHIPCRKCLYDAHAKIPYSELDKDIKMVRDYHLS